MQRFSHWAAFLAVLVLAAFLFSFLVARYAKATGTVAFVVGGNLYARNLATGSLQTVAKGGVTYLSWSPNGSALAYLQGGVLKAIPYPAGGLVRRLGPAAWFRWAPGGKAIAYAGPRGGLMVTGGSRLNRSTQVSRHALRGYWSPGGKRLAFSVPGRGLGIYDLSNLAPTPTIVGPRFFPVAASTQLCWSPAGKGIAFVKRLPHPRPIPGAGGKTYYSYSHALTVLDPATGRTRVLFSVPGGGVVPYGWWPNGQGLIFWTIPQNSMSLAADGEGLYSMPLAGGRPRLLGTSLVNSDFLAWSPKGNLLAVVLGGSRDAPLGKNLDLFRPDGTGRRLLAGTKTVSALYPVWSSGGQEIAYLSMPSGPYDPRQFSTASGSFNWSVWKVGTSGKGRTRVAAVPSGIGSYQWTRFTPDGHHMLVVDRLAGPNQPGPAQLFLMDTNGEHVILLAQGLGAGSGSGFQGLATGDPNGLFYGQVDWSSLVALRPAS